MAATNFTPISLYYSATASATPSASNLVAGELAINTADGKLFYKDSSGVVQTLASKAGNVNVSSFSGGTTGLTPNTATTGVVTLGGTLNVANGGTGATTLTGYVYGNGTGAMTASTTIPTSSLSGTINLTTQVTGTLPVGNGGTGLTTLTSGYIPYGNGTSAFSSNAGLSYDGTNLTVGTSTTATTFIKVNGNTGSAQGAGFLVQQAGTYIGFLGNKAAIIGAGTSQDFFVQSQNNLSFNTVGASTYFNWQYNGSETMRLTSAGYLGIGTSSPSYKLDVSNNANAFVARFTGGTSSDVNIGVYANTASAFGSIGTISNHKFQIFTNGNDVAIFDTSGNLGLGVTPSGWSAIKPLEFINGVFVASYNVANVANAYFGCNTYYNGSNWIYKTTDYASYYQQSAGKHLWYNAPSSTSGAIATFTQAMTLDNSGNLLVGTTSLSNKLSVVGPSGSYVCRLGLNGTGTQYFMNFVIGENTTPTGVGSISTNGTTTSYNITSDQRLKTNIVDAPAGNIDLIKVRSFNWKLDGSHQTYGFIAQELVEVAPYAVHQPTNPEEMMGVDYSKLVPMMIREIQDLKAEVNQLKQKLGV